MPNKRFLLTIIAAISCLILITVFISVLGLDLKCASYFFDKQTESWPQGDAKIWDWAYHYGPYPAILLSIFSLIALIFSVFIPRLTSLRRYCIFILLTMTLGPGLLVNGIFKDRWGRPRPRQVEQFGGRWEFREVWEPGIPGKGKSFPSGHSSMGFFLIIIYFVYRRKNDALAYSGILVSLLMGGFIGTARMAQGGHFLSDVIWAGGMTYGAAAVLSSYLLKIPDDEKIQKKKINRNILFKRAAIVFFVALFIYVFGFSKPVYEEYIHKSDLAEKNVPIVFKVNMDTSDEKLIFGKYESPIEVQTTLHGYGFPEHDLKSQLLEKTLNDTLHVNYILSISGIFQSMNVTTNIYLDTTRTIILAGKKHPITDQ